MACIPVLVTFELSLIASYVKLIPCLHRQTQMRTQKHKLRNRHPPAHSFLAHYYVKLRTWGCITLFFKIHFKDFSCHFMQPRILMAMARDGLLPSFFADVNKRTQVPVKSTVVTGLCAAALAFFMDVSQLAGMVRNLPGCYLWIY